MMENSSEYARPRILADAERVIQHEVQRLQQRSIRELSMSRAPVVAGHPRSLSAAERRVQQQNSRLWQRQLRDTVQARGIGTIARPSAPDTGQVQHREKNPSAGYTAVSAASLSSTPAQERVSAAQLTWIALGLSIAALLLLGLFSMKKFGPEFQVKEVQINQKQLATDIEDLKHAYQIEQVKGKVLNARLYLLVHNDYTRAEALLFSAKQDILEASRTGPEEKRPIVKQLLNDVDGLLQELRREPLPLDQRLDDITTTLENL